MNKKAFEKKEQHNLYATCRIQIIQCNGRLFIPQLKIAENALLYYAEGIEVSIQYFN